MSGLARQGAAGATARRYERGENRRKHVGRLPQPEIVKVGDEVVGKCPTGKTDAWRQALLDGAVGMITIDPYSEAFPKRLFCIDGDGTIYAAQTTSPGDSYHGYPYEGPLGKRVLRVLEEKAGTLGCTTPFRKWVKEHITIAGKPDI